MEFPNPILEEQFRKWYLNLPVNRNLSSRGLDIPPPDDPEHFYDYRGAFLEGMNADNLSGHLTSKFKKMGHPRAFLGGEDTRVWHPDKTNSLSDLLGRVGTDSPNAELPIYNSILKDNKKNALRDIFTP